MASNTVTPGALASSYDDLVEAIAARVVEALGAQSNVRDLAGTAAYFGVSERQVTGWREKGVPARRVGKRLLFHLPEVEAWLLDQERV